MALAGRKREQGLRSNLVNTHTPSVLIALGQFELSVGMTLPAQVRENLNCFSVVRLPPKAALAANARYNAVDFWLMVGIFLSQQDHVRSSHLVFF